MISHDKPQLKRYKFPAVLAIGGLALVGCGDKVVGAQSDSTPVPSETTATAPVTPGAETTAATPTAETETNSPEIIGNIDVSKLSPAARDYAAQLTPELTSKMNADQFRDALRITPDMTGSDDPSLLAELAFVRVAVLDSAGLTPEVLAKARAAGVLFEDLVYDNYLVAGVEADSGIGAIPNDEDASNIRDRAQRYDVLASIDPKLAPVTIYSLESIESTPETLQATLSLSATESQPLPSDQQIATYALDPSVARHLDRSPTVTYAFNLATVDGEQIWNIDEAKG